MVDEAKQFHVNDELNYSDETLLKRANTNRNMRERQPRKGIGETFTTPWSINGFCIWSRSQHHISYCMLVYVPSSYSTADGTAETKLAHAEEAMPYKRMVKIFGKEVVAETNGTKGNRWRQPSNHGETQDWHVEDHEVLLRSNTSDVKIVDKSDWVLSGIRCKL